MESLRDPFLILSLSYDASPEDVRAAFRRRARQTHPDRGGTARAFQEVREAYGILSEHLERERSRWRPQAPTPRVSRYAARLDPRIYPTCLVRISQGRDGSQMLDFEVDSRPEGWSPSTAPPPGGECQAQRAATESAPAFGIWLVPLDDDRFRCVFGPAPSAG